MLGLTILPLSTIFRFWDYSDCVVFSVFLDFGTIPTVWYFLFFISFCIIGLRIISLLQKYTLDYTYGVATSEKTCHRKVVVFKTHHRPKQK